MGARKAKRMVVQEDGFYHATLTDVVEGTGQKTEKKGRDTNTIAFQRFEFYFNVMSNKADDPIGITLFTGTVINDEPDQERGRGNKIIKLYNRYTTVLMAFGLVKESELEGLSDADCEKIGDKMMTLSGVQVRFKGSKNERGYFDMDVQSLEVMKKTAKK